MQNSWIFKLDEYRSVVLKKLKDESENHGYRTALAKAAGCQLAYISHVLNNNAQFTPDHAAGIAEFWALDELETDYFLGLVDLARAATGRLKKQIERKLNKIRSEYENAFLGRLSHQPYNSERVIEYFIDWAAAATHALIMIPEYQDTASISKRLKIDDVRVNSILSLLQDLGFAQRVGSHWKATSRFFHAGDENKFSQLHHRNWRQYVYEKLNQTQVTSESFHYTAIHALSKEDLKKIKRLMQELLANSRSVVAPSPEETIACMNLDWFEL